MSQKPKKGLSVGWAAALCGGVGLSFALCCGLMAIFAALVAGGKLPEDAMSRLCGAALLAGCLGGGICAAVLLGRRTLPAALAVSGGTVLVWLVVGQGMFGGWSPGALPGCLLWAGLGALLAALLTPRRKKSRN